MFPEGCELFQQDNETCYVAKMLEDRLGGRGEFEAWTDLKPIGHLRAVLDKHVPTTGLH